VRAALLHGREPLAPPVALRLWKHLAVFAPVRVSASGSLRPEKRGETLLVDGLSGSLSHKDGAWLGVEGGDLNAVVDLGRRRTVRRVAARFLEHPAAWIFLPTRVDVEISANGVTGPGLLPANGRSKTISPSCAAARPICASRADRRYVRLAARGIGTCPAGHTGAAARPGSSSTRSPLNEK